jgi:hypothetical protein
MMLTRDEQAVSDSRPAATPNEVSLEFDVGSVLSGPYPFVREKVSLWDGEGMSDELSWIPGVRFEASGPEDSEAVADGIGSIVLHVEGMFKPGRFPMRVFFTRQWVSPDSRVFGKTRLRIATLQQFRRLARGYRHEFRVTTNAGCEGLAGGVGETQDVGASTP